MIFISGGGGGELLFKKDGVLFGNFEQSKP